MTKESDELATLLRLAQTIAKQRPNEAFYLAYNPTAETWHYIQVSGSIDIAHLSNSAPTLAEALETFITKKR